MSRHSRFSKYRWRMGGASTPFRTILTLFICGLILGFAGLFLYGVWEGSWIRTEYDPYPSETTLYNLGANQMTAFISKTPMGTNPPTDEYLTKVFWDGTHRNPMPGDSVLMYCLRTEHMHSYVKVDPNKGNEMQSWIEMVPVREIPATEPTATPTAPPFPTATCTPMVYPPTSTPKPTPIPEK